MDKKELEIMSPAGNFECLHAAIQGGADSVYFGVGNLNMRSHSANNFTPDDLPRIVEICREYGVKTYMTLNIVLYGEDLAPMREALDAAKAAGVNAIIASDMAAITYCRKIGLEVHISTQLNVSNVEALRFYSQFADVLACLRRVRVRGGIAHAFNGSRQQAEHFIDLGFKLGFGGAMTYSGSSRIRRLAAELPLSSLVLETDAPDIPPSWCPQGRSEPAFLVRYAEELATLRNVDVAAVRAATSQNVADVLSIVG